MVALAADEEWDRGDAGEQHPDGARIAPTPYLGSGEPERDTGEREGDQQGAAVVGAVFAVDSGVSTRTRRPAMNMARQIGRLIQNAARQSVR